MVLFPRLFPRFVLFPRFGFKDSVVTASASGSMAVQSSTSGSMRSDNKQHSASEKTVDSRACAPHQRVTPRSTLSPPPAHDGGQVAQVPVQTLRALTRADSCLPGGLGWGRAELRRYPQLAVGVGDGHEKPAQLIEPVKGRGRGRGRSAETSAINCIGSRSRARWAPWLFHN